MIVKDFNLDKKTIRRIKALQKQKYPNPVEKANFEKIPLNKLEKLLYIANSVKKRRLENKDAHLKTNPVTIRIRNMKDAFNFANELIDNSLYIQKLDSGLVGEAILIESYSKIPIEKLEIEILEINREIKRKKEEIRVKNDAGNVNKLVDSIIPLPSPNTN